MTTQWHTLALVGRIARTHGVRGHLIINPDTDFPERRFRVGNRVHVRREGRIDVLTISSVRFHQGRPLVSFEGIESLSEAEPLLDLELRVPVEGLATLPADTFYRHDLVGCAVTLMSGEPVGSVAAVQGAVERSRLVVRTGRDDILVPLVAEICVRIDPGARTIVIDPPAGLLELNVTAKTRGSS